MSVKGSPRTYCPVCGRKMTLSNVFKEPGGRISWKFVCHHCDTATQFYTGDNFDNQPLDEATEKGEDTMTKENGRTYKNFDELNKALKEIDSGLWVGKTLTLNKILEIDFFGNILATVNCPDINHLEGYWFELNASASGYYKTSKIIKNVMDVVNNLLAQFDMYTPDGFWDRDDQDSKDEEDYDF